MCAELLRPQLLNFSTSSGRVRMELRGRERHRWAKPRGRNDRERMSQAFTSSTADFRFQSAPVPEPVYPQYDRHQKINPAAPLDLLGRQSKRQDQRHEPDAYWDAPA